MAFTDPSTSQPNTTAPGASNQSVPSWDSILADPAFVAAKDWEKVAAAQKYYRQHIVTDPAFIAATPEDQDIATRNFQSTVPVEPSVGRALWRGTLETLGGVAGVAQAGAQAVGLGPDTWLGEKLSYGKNLLKGEASLIVRPPDERPYTEDWWQPYKMAEDVAQAIPGVALAVAGGLPYRASTATATAVASGIGGLLEGEQQYQELTQRGATPEQALLGMLEMTLTSAGLNALPFAKFFGKGWSTNKLVNAVSQGLAEAASEYGEEIGSAVITQAALKNGLEPGEFMARLKQGIEVTIPAFLLGAGMSTIGGNGKVVPKGAEPAPGTEETGTPSTGAGEAPFQPPALETAEGGLGYDADFYSMPPQQQQFARTYTPASVPLREQELETAEGTLGFTPIPSQEAPGSTISSQSATDTPLKGIEAQNALKATGNNPISIRVINKKGEERVGLFTVSELQLDPDENIIRVHGKWDNKGKKIEFGLGSVEILPAPLDSQNRRPTVKSTGSEEIDNPLQQPAYPKVGMSKPQFSMAEEGETSTVTKGSLGEARVFGDPADLHQVIHDLPDGTQVKMSAGYNRMYEAVKRVFPNLDISAVARIERVNGDKYEGDALGSVVDRFVRIAVEDMEVGETEDQVVARLGDKAGLTLGHEGLHVLIAALGPNDDLVQVGLRQYGSEEALVQKAADHYARLVNGEPAPDLTFAQWLKSIWEKFVRSIRSLSVKDRAELLAARMYEGGFDQYNLPGWHTVFGEHLRGSEFGPKEAQRTKDDLLKELAEVEQWLASPPTTGGQPASPAMIKRFEAKRDNLYRQITATPSFSMKEEYKPKSTIVAYKLFQTKKSAPGQLFPLFIDKASPVPIGSWLAAKHTPTKGFAERPGWHSGSAPLAPHLMKKDGTLPSDRVWAEVEIPADVDWQSEADKSPTKDIKGKVPHGGFYRFPRPFNQGGEWQISGELKVNRILSPEEVAQINQQKGLSLSQPKFSMKEASDNAPGFREAVTVHDQLRALASSAANVGKWAADAFSVEAPFLRTGEKLGELIGEQARRYQSVQTGFNDHTIYNIAKEGIIRTLAPLYQRQGSLGASIANTKLGQAFAPLLGIDKPAWTEALDNFALIHESKQAREDFLRANPDKAAAYTRAFKIVDDYIAESLELLKQHGVTDDFKARAIQMAHGEILTMKEEIASWQAKLARTHSANIRSQLEPKIAENKRLIAELEDRLNNLADLNYLPMPTSLILNSGKLMGTKRGRMAAIRFLTAKQRGDVKMADLLKKVDPDTGKPYFEKSDFSIIKVLSSYSYKVGRDLGMARVLNAALGRKFMIDERTGKGHFVSVNAPKDELWAYKMRDPDEPLRKGFVRLRTSHGSYIEDYALREPLASWFESQAFRNLDETLAPIWRFWSAIKMAQFYNPFILPAYNVYQAWMAGGALSLLKGRVWKKAWNSAVNRDEHWAAMQHYGGFSHPFADTANSLLDTMNRMARTNPKLHGLMNLGLPIQAVKHAYAISQDAAWHMDRFTRMFVYFHLMDMGLDSEMAAKRAAEYMGDYANVPQGTRVFLNKLFFTPTFKIATARMQKNMVKAAITHARNALQGKKTPYEVTNMSQGLMLSVGALFLTNMLMRAFGFKDERWGWKYVKNVETEEGPKQLVITWSNPINLLPKYGYRWQDAANPAETNSIQRWLDSTSWELHPIWRTVSSLVQNRNERGEAIVNPFDSFAKIQGDRSWYFFSRTIPMFKWFQDTWFPNTTIDSKEAVRVLDKNVNTAFAYLMRAAAFPYLRSSADQRAASQMNKLIIEYRVQMRRNLRNTDPAHWDKAFKREEERMKRLQEKLDQVWQRALEEKE